MRLVKLAPDCIYFLLQSSASLCSLINKKTSPLHTLGALCLCSPATQLTPHQNAHLLGVYCRTTAQQPLTFSLTYITHGVRNSPLTVLRKHIFSFGVCVRFSLGVLPWVFITLLRNLHVSDIYCLQDCKTHSSLSTVTADILHKINFKYRL